MRERESNQLLAYTQLDRKVAHERLTFNVLNRATTASVICIYCFVLVLFLSLSFLLLVRWLKANARPSTICSFETIKQCARFRCTLVLIVYSSVHKHLFCDHCCFVSSFILSSSRGFFSFGVLILLLFIFILQKHRCVDVDTVVLCGCRGDRASHFPSNYPSLLFQIMIIKTYSNCFRSETRAFHLKIAFYYSSLTRFRLYSELHCVHFFLLLHFR